MSENKPAISLTVLAGLAITFILGYAIARWWPGEIGAQCPQKLQDYCSDWNVASSEVEDPTEHLDVPDQFSIRATSKGVEPPIWLMAKSGLQNRWKGQPKIKLREIESGGSVDCMVGRIDLSHDGGDHDWHQITFRTEANPSRNNQIELAMCVTKRDNGDWPNECRIDDCGGVSPQMHGGRAHAQP